MIVRYGNISIVLILIGLLGQTLGTLIGVMFDATSGVVVSVAGIYVGATATLCWGLAYAAKAKRRHVLWGLSGVGSYLGVVAILVLRDKTVQFVPLYCQACGYDLHGSGRDSCPECGSAVIKM